MSDNAAERFRRLFDYERDSHARVLASLAGVPEELRATEGYRKAAGLLAHIVLARRLWLSRLGAGVAGPKNVTDFFPQNVALSDLAAQLEETQAAWTQYLAGLTDEAAARGFEYRSLDGARFRNTVEDILTQLFGHSLYHRGQIALLLRAIGAEPAATDFVYWAREPLSEG
jgi:uncharacterized damage-inducible protein DinB